MDAFFTSSGLLALITLTFLETVLGVDNVIFISIPPVASNVRILLLWTAYLLLTPTTVLAPECSRRTEKDRQKSIRRRD